MTTPQPHAHTAMPRRNWLIALLLAACYTLAYADRQVVSIVIEPLKRSLGLTDTQIGLMQGISFSLFYVAASLPLAWLADRTSRPRVMSGCVALWSLLAMLCGAVASFPQLMALRIGIAASEAGLTPAALATLGDRFDPRRLATATALYMLAPFVGGGLAIFAGGAIYAAAEGWSHGGLPLLAGLDPWRTVFVLVGAPGLLAALLLLLIRDRRRAPAAGAADKGASFGEMLSYVFAEWRIFVGYGLAMGLTMTLLSGYVTWLPSALMRAEHLGPERIGLVFGPIYLVAGSAGTILAGLFVGARSGTDPVSTILRTMLATNALLWPIAIFGLLVPGLTAKLALMGAAILLISAMTSLSSLPTQHLSPPRFRAQVLALLAMVAALFGTGLGPVLAGALSDRMTGVAQPLSVALAAIGGVTVPLVELLLWMALRRYRRVRLDLGVVG